MSLAKTKLLTVFLVIILMLTNIVACQNEKIPTDEELIEERITAFLTAYNNGDLETILECMATKPRNAFQAMINLIGGLAGSLAGSDIDLSDLFSLGVNIAPDDFMKLEIKDITVIDDTNATAKASMNLIGTDNYTVYFDMVYENDGWYINDMTDKNSGYESNDEINPPPGSNAESDDTNNSTSYILKTFSETDEYGNAGTYSKINNKYNVGDTVELEATVNSGYNFVGWYIGDVCISNDTKYTLTMKSSNVEIEARYNYYTIITSSDSDEYGMAGTYTELQNEKISVGDEVTLEATVNPGYNFEGWYIDNVCVCPELTYQFVMDGSNKTIIAKYSYYTLTTEGRMNKWNSTLSHLPNIAGTYSEYYKEKISNGTVVSLVATLGEGYTFKGWYINGVCVSEDLEYSYTMTKENVKIQARYTYYTISTKACLQYESYKTAFGDNMGTYTKYDEEKIRIGDTVTLTATTKPGYKFLGWRYRNTIVCEDLVYTFVMETHDETYEAVFAVIE